MGTDEQDQPVEATEPPKEDTSIFEAPKKLPNNREFLKRPSTFLGVVAIASVISSLVLSVVNARSVREIQKIEQTLQELNIKLADAEEVIARMNIQLANKTCLSTMETIKVKNQFFDQFLMMKDGTLCRIDPKLFEVDEKKLMATCGQFSPEHKQEVDNVITKTNDPLNQLKTMCKK